MSIIESIQLLYESQIQCTRVCVRSVLAVLIRREQCRRARFTLAWLRRVALVERVKTLREIVACAAL
jgi:hypothetical protein